MKRFSNKNKTHKKHITKRKNIKRRRTKKIIGGVFTKFLARFDTKPKEPPTPLNIEDFFNNLNNVDFNSYRTESTDTLSTTNTTYPKLDRFILQNGEMFKQITADEYKFLENQLKEEFDDYYKGKVIEKLKERYKSLEMADTTLPIYDLFSKLSYLDDKGHDFLNKNNRIGVFFKYIIDGQPKYFIFTKGPETDDAYLFGFKRLEKLLSFLLRKLQNPETIKVFIKFDQEPPHESRAPTVIEKSYTERSAAYLKDNHGYRVKDIISENISKLHNLFKFIIPKLGQKYMDNLNNETSSIVGDETKTV